MLGNCWLSAGSPSLSERPAQGRLHSAGMRKYRTFLDWESFGAEARALDQHLAVTEPSVRGDKPRMVHR
jgi:hypothetical protein